MLEASPTAADQLSLCPQEKRKQARTEQGMREERGEETEEQEGGDGVRRIHGRRWEGALSGEREGCGGRGATLHYLGGGRESGAPFPLQQLSYKKGCYLPWCFENEEKHPVAFYSCCLFLFSFLLVCLF